MTAELLTRIAIVLPVMAAAILLGALVLTLARDE